MMSVRDGGGLVIDTPDDVCVCDDGLVIDTPDDMCDGGWLVIDTPDDDDDVCVWW